MYETQSYSPTGATAVIQASKQLAGEHHVSSSAAEKELPTPKKTGTETIETRFGKVTVNYDNPLIFAKGMLGMANKMHYCLLDFPVAKFPKFKLLQSLDDLGLSFIVLPVDIDNAIIKRADIDVTARDAAIATEDLSLLLVVSVQRDGNEVRLSVNARAPLFIDAKKRTAEQIVLRSNDYHVRHMISGSDVA